MHDILGQDHVTFCDNEAAKHALIRGYGTDTNINNMIAMCWTHAAQTNSQPWIDRVSSKANLSDGVSRDDWELADQMGWARLDLDMTPAYAVFQQLANDSTYAYTTAAQQLQSVMKDQIMEELNKIPWSKDLRF